VTPGSVDQQYQAGATRGLLRRSSAHAAPQKLPQRALIAPSGQAALDGSVLAVAEAGVTVWYNPRCSKCRGAEELLAAHGVPAQRVFYLDNPPARAEIARVLALLKTADPRALMRTSEPRYAELGLADATASELIDAMARYPELIQRPVVIWADRAVIARPPELLLPLLEAGQHPPTR
jgi:arsenate reductase (glutaredoxin)